MQAGDQKLLFLLEWPSSHLAKHSAAARCTFLARIGEPIVSDLDKLLEKLKDYWIIEKKN